MLDDICLGNILLLDKVFKRIIDFRQLFLPEGFDVLTNDLQRVAILNRLIIIIGVQVVAKHAPRFSFTLQQRRSCQGDLDGIGVRIEQIGEERAFRLIASMRLVDDEHALKICGVRRQDNLVMAFRKALNIDNSDFWFACRAFLRLVGFELLHQFGATIRGFDNQTSRLKLFLRLFQQVKAVNNEIVFRYLVHAGKVVSQHIRQVIGQRGLAAALRVPDNARLDAF